MVGVPRGEFFTTDYTDCTDFFIFFRVNSRYSRLILARPCEIPKSQCIHLEIDPLYEICVILCEFCADALKDSSARIAVCYLPFAICKFVALPRCGVFSLKHYRILFIVRCNSLERELLPVLRQKYEVLLAHGRKEALTTLTPQAPDLVLVDVPSIRFNLDRFCDDLKAQSPCVLLFFLLGKGMRLDKLPKSHGFLRHSFSTRQLLNRLTRVLPQHDGETVEWRGLRLNHGARSLAWDTEEFFLTPKQTALLEAFLLAPEKTLSRAYLMQEVWGTDYLGDTRTLDVHLHGLRKALRSLEAPFHLVTQRGKGYRLVSLDEET